MMRLTIPAKFVAPAVQKRMMPQAKDVTATNFPGGK